MKRLSLVLAVFLALVSFPAAAAPQATWINPSYGAITSPTNIDAITFINYGYFGSQRITITNAYYYYLGSLFTWPEPYETYDTLNYTNFGSIFGTFGWRFEHTPANGDTRGMAANFVNENSGLVQAFDYPNAAEPLRGLGCVDAPVYPSFLFISASNIINRGTMAVGPNGVATLTGKRIDLKSSTLEVKAVWDEPTANITYSPPTNFIPDLAIYDEYWVQDVFNDDYRLNSGALWNGITASYPGVDSPPSQPTISFPGTMFNPVADSYINRDPMFITVTNWVDNPTNVTIYTTLNVDVGSNYWKGAVFVGGGSGMSVATDFQRSLEYNNGHDSIGVVLSIPVWNPVSEQTDVAYVYVRDDLAADSTLRGLSVNDVGCYSTTYRPQCYTVRRQPSSFFGNAGNHGVPESDFFTASGVRAQYPTNAALDAVTNLSALAEGTYAAYGAYLDNIVSRPRQVEGDLITNAPGRIEIRGNSVDLTDTRMRAEGQVIVQTPHLIASSNTVIDCESLSYNVGSTNGHLTIQNMVPNTVARLNGNLQVWSALWQNEVTVVLTNYAFYTNEVPIAVPPGSTNIVGTNFYLCATNAFVTNSFTINYYSLMVDAQSLILTKPVSVYEFATTTRDVTINDNMRVIQAFNVDGRSLTINGTLTFPGYYPLNPLLSQVLSTPTPAAIENWGDACAPSLLYFTNNGSINIANVAAYGESRRYATFINNGLNQAVGINVNSDYFENQGVLSADGSLFMRGKNGKLENGYSTNGFVCQFDCDNLKFSNYEADSGGMIYLNVTNSLTDAGAAFTNYLVTSGGIGLSVKPRTGDLLGTEVWSVAKAAVVELNHIWAGEDRGVNAAGFVDNAAVGRLVLYSQSNHPKFRFMGAGSGNAIYVDQLDLTGITNANPLGCLEILSGMKVYYASVKLPSGFALTVSQNRTNTPEEQLDGALGGKLRWIPSYAGANSGANTVISNQTFWVNKALVNSQMIDSDGDSVNNYYDTNGVFKLATLTVVKNGQGTLTPEDLSGKPLLVGQSYRMTAVPDDGFTFSHWTSNGVPIYSSTFVFTMTNVLQLTANFNYAATAGTYGGLFYQEPLTNNSQWQYSGAFKLKTTSKGKYSGSLQMGKNKYSFSGMLGAGGAVTNTVYRKNSTPLVLKFQAGKDQILGTVGDQAENWTAQIQADRAAYGKGNTAPYASKYTILFPGVNDSADTIHPQGDGYGTVAVNKSGKVKFSGSLADGTKVTQSAIVSLEGQWPLYVPLYSGQGQVLGWMTFEDSAEQDLSGLASWIKQPNAKAKFYSGGFDMETEATGSAYNPAQVPVTGFTSGTVALYGGNFSSGITNSVDISSRNKVTSSGANKFALKLDKSRGLFKGSLRDASGSKVSFGGVILQKQGFGSGYFLGADQSGSVDFEP